MKRLTLPGFLRGAAMSATVLMLWTQPQAKAQEPVTSRGENFSAKPPAALFASDCTGAGCHKGPQGLAKGQGFGSLAGFLREHYTNSRESAAALASYLSKIPGSEPKEARSPRGGKPATAAAPAPSGPASWFEGAGVAAPSEAKPSRQGPANQNAATHPAGRASRAAVKPDEDPAAAPAAPSATSAAHQPPAAEPGESGSKPEEPAAKPGESSAKPAEPAAKPAKPNPTARAQRGRQPAATAAAPPPPPEPVPAAPPPPAPPPAPKEYDIFD
jgi:hypothetical protein